MAFTYGLSSKAPTKSSNQPNGQKIGFAAAGGPSLAMHAASQPVNALAPPTDARQESAAPRNLGATAPPGTVSTPPVVSHPTDTTGNLGSSFGGAFAGLGGVNASLPQPPAARAQPAASSPTTSAATAPGKAPADTRTPEQIAEDDYNAGVKHNSASGIGAVGSMGRLTDAHAGEMSDLLARQRASLDGMTPAEQLAAREQGTATINRQLAQNMQQFGDIAAGNGIRGGSATGLQMQALGQAQDASGQLARQMILDNVAQKNVAMQRYGDTLGQQQGVGLGIQDSNNQSANAETLGRNLDINNWGSNLDSVRAGIKSDALSNRGIDIAEHSADSLAAIAAGGKGPNGAAAGGGHADDSVLTSSLSSLGQDTIKELDTPGPGGHQRAEAARDKATTQIQQFINDNYPNATDEERQKMVTDKLRDWLFNTGIIRPDGSWRY